MVKTNTPVRQKIAGKSVHLNALPDPFDENDLIYRPRLKLLPHFQDQRAGQPILDQKGNSCTGHAVAALVDTVLSTPLTRTPAHGAPNRTTVRVSPYMLYAMARRYDEFPGEEDFGSSLRGAFKGWYHHGVCSDKTWPNARNEEKRDLDAEAFVAECRKIPLGAYYRVKAQRLDDMQSAVLELNAIAVSAAVHSGWGTPVKENHDGKDMWVIREGAEAWGGHAFLIAGYNSLGFLVQNSWGTTWGHNGYATLPYDDWLEHAYDAWVARPGVPQVADTLRKRVVIPTAFGLITGTGPNLGRLKSFVIDVAAEGKLSPSGDVSSTPTQIAGLATAMEKEQTEWVKAEKAADPTATPKRRVVLYAHGGLVGESGGIAVADRMIDWWRANHIYPIHIVWESDALTTIMAFFHRDASLRAGGVVEFAQEAVDRTIETLGRGIQPLWREMKDNATKASGRLKGTAPANEPGVTLFINHLIAYRKRFPDLEVHLVGHSAGSVVLAAAVERLVAERIPVESLQLMGGAIPVDEFIQRVGPSLKNTPGGTGMLRRFTAYDLEDFWEQADVCPGPPIPAIYHKSLLYFVCRALEPKAFQFEKPMVGLAKFFNQPAELPNGTKRPFVDIVGGSDSLVVSPTKPTATLYSRSNAHGHADFDDDPDTMTSVMLRILKRNDLAGLTAYPRGGMPTG